MSTPTPEQTQDKMSWKDGDVEWVKTPAPPKKKSAAQRLADRIRRDGDNQQRG